MMNVGLNTKAYSPAEQESSLKTDKSQSLTPEEQKKLLGNEDLGTYLNKIADPNWVDPSKMRHVGGSSLDKDAFLKLFLAQLKNQDPTNPMKSHELAAQLAQFTSLERLTNIDSSISKLAKKDGQNARWDALALIGKGISGDSSKIERNDVTATHEIEFKLGAPASDVTLSIRNGADQEVKKFLAHNLKKGANKIFWNGLLDNGAAAPKGEYHVVITAKNNFGQKIAVETAFTGRVTGVNFTPEGPVLMLGKQSVRMKDVKNIFNIGDQGHDNATLVKAQPVAVKADKHPPQAPVAGMAAGGGLANVGMSQGLMNQLNKEVNKSASSAGAQAANSVKDKLNI